MNTFFPSLDEWETTRDTLHWYTKAIGAVSRAHALPHPRWWHISLKVHPDGLVTESMLLPDGGIFFLKMDLRKHALYLQTSWGETQEFSLADGLTATQFGEQLISAVSALGLAGNYAVKPFTNDEPRLYHPPHASNFFTALVSADRIFREHRASLPREVGPVQLWPHNFDLALEWFGTRQVVSEEGGEKRFSQAQLNLGFSPGDSSHPQPYFYSNPWPFEADYLLDKPLPAGARWFMDSWQGSIFPYAELSAGEQADARIKAYARAVFDLSAPTLSADWVQ